MFCDAAPVKLDDSADLKFKSNVKSSGYNKMGKYIQ